MQRAITKTIALVKKYENFQNAPNEFLESTIVKIVESKISG